MAWNILPECISGSWYLNAQSTIMLILGWNKIHQTQSLIHCSWNTHFMLKLNGKMKLNEQEKQELHRQSPWQQAKQHFNLLQAYKTEALNQEYDAIPHKHYNIHTLKHWNKRELWHLYTSRSFKATLAVAVVVVVVVVATADFCLEMSSCISFCRFCCSCSSALRASSLRRCRSAFCLAMNCRTDSES